MTLDSFFKNKPIIQTFTPGRINIIGEHTDYNGGSALPAAITLGIVAFAEKSTNFEIYNTNFNECYTYSQTKPENNHWTFKAYACFHFLKTNYPNLSPMRVFMKSDLPMAAGMSSSAAFIISLLGTYFQIVEAYITPIALCSLAQEIEHKYLLTPCGLLDQVAIVFSKKNHVVDFNFPFKTFKTLGIGNSLQWKVIVSPQHRNLASTAYAKRVEECTSILETIKKHKPLLHLSECNFDDLNILPSEILRKRLKHIVSENLRVQEMKTALTNSDSIKIGTLLNQSHLSLSNDYEVSTQYIDTLIQFLIENNLCYGARIMGAGFGGSILVLANNNFELNMDKLQNHFKGISQNTLPILDVKLGDGFNYSYL